MRARESSYLGPILLNWDSTPARSPGNNRRPWLPSPVLDTRVQPDRESHSHAYHGPAEFLSRLRGWTRTGAVEEAFRRSGCRRWRCVASNEGTFRTRRCELVEFRRIAVVRERLEAQRILISSQV